MLFNMIKMYKIKFNPARAASKVPARLSKVPKYDGEVNAGALIKIIKKGLLISTPGNIPAH